MTDAPSSGPEPAPRRPRRWRRRLVGFAVLTVLLGFAAELAVLLIWGVQPKMPRRVVGAPWGLRYNEPGARYRHTAAHGAWDFAINAQGMRAERDYPHEKPEGVNRILSLGDSFTIGYEVDLEQCFSSVLERELRAGGHRVEVLNCGVSGFGNAEELLYVERELLAFDPDLVLVSFFGNDLEDNVRSALFRLEDGRLVSWHETYVPAGGIGNFLNTNWAFNLLSERSDAFAFAKFWTTQWLKGRMASRSAAEMGGAVPEDEPAGSAAWEERLVRGTPEQRQLCAALFQRLLDVVSDREIPLVVQSIPQQFVGDHEPLYEQFPVDVFDTRQPGVWFVPAKAWLDPLASTTKLYYHEGHGHWLPSAHELSGRNLAVLIRSEGLLD